MPKHLMLVLTNPVEGKDAEFNDWYTNTHLPDIVALDGFSAAQRFRLIPDERSDGAAHQYLAIYEIEGDDYQRAKESLAATRGGGLVISEALDRSNTVAQYFEAISERLCVPED